MIALYGTAQYGIARYGLNLITDRTGGYYNAIDLNNVESVFEYLETKMNGDYGFNLSLTTKTDWNNEDLGQLGAQALMETYRQNVVVLRLAISTDTEPPDSMRFLTAEGANNIEKILQEIEEVLDNIPFAWVYSGQKTSGQGGLI